MKYRKKPVVIEAVQFTRSNWEDIERWGGKLVKAVGNWNGELPLAIQITTLEGIMTAVDGDWIIKGINGEFYPCKPDIFAATYEPAEKETTG